MVAQIGIIGEHKPGEGRIPLTPPQIQKICLENPDIKFMIQSSPQRSFAAEEFTELGLPMVDSVREAKLVMAVKELDVKDIHPGGAYIFFSHTIKGQEYNMDMLQHILNVGATLCDYELIKDEGGRRLVFFGRHAGLAGMVNTLWAYGKRLQALGQETPFLEIKQALEYHDMELIGRSFKDLAPRLAAWLADKPPIVIGITGYGNVSRGVQEILALLPIVELSAESLLTCDLTDYRGKLVKVVFKESDMFKPLAADEPFILQDYFDNPERYTNNFNQYLARLNILVNCIYWDTPYPRLISLDEIREHYAKDPSLLVVGDITCDIDGAIQFNIGSTLSPDPVYVYHPDSGERSMGFRGDGPLIMAIDNLPSELPRESSEAFGEALIPFVPAMARCDYTVCFENLELPAEIKRAVIAHAGMLTPDYEYLREFLKV